MKPQTRIPVTALISSADKHVDPKLHGGPDTPCKQYLASFPVRHAAEFAGGGVDFQETKDDIDKHDERETQRAVYPAGDLLENQDQPSHVEVLGPEAGNHDAVPFEPLGHLVIQKLEPRGVGDDIASGLC